MKKNLLLILFVLAGCLSASAQWGANADGVAIFPEGTNYYDNQTVIGADGTIWFFAYRPNDGVYEMRLQALDKDGNKKFGDEGLVVSNYGNLSWTEVNQYLYANSDSTVTMIVRDIRNSDDENRLLTYTAYRISPDGEQLWGEDGVNLDESMQADGVVCMTFCELSDGSTAFAWQHCYGAGTCLEIQKVSKDGKCLYNLDDTRLSKTNGYYVYPYMVPSDNGSFIIVYGYTSSYYLKAMKFNSDGTQAWEKQADIYKGGWGSTMSLQSRMRVYPGPDDGVVVSWNDDRNYDGWYSAYIAYIKKDGTSAFTNADGKCDIKLSYEEYSAYPPHLAITDDAIYAVFSQFSDYNQSWNQLTVQKVNMNGEILWGDNGVQVIPMSNDNQCCGSENIALGKDGKMGVFYERFYDYHNVQNCMSIRSTEDGSAVNAENPETIWRSSKHYRESKNVLRSDVDDTWVVSWIDDAVSCGVDSKTRNTFYTKFDFDGNELGVGGTEEDGIQTVGSEESRVKSEEMYNLNGQRISTPQCGQVYIQDGKKVVR